MGRAFEAGRILVAAALAALFAGCRSADWPDGVRESGTAFAGEALAPYVERGEIAGGVSIFYDDGRQETCCIGYADREAKRPITIDDPFMQCSQTKGFCGVTIAMLIEEGRISLDDPVSKYLPEFATLWVREGETNGVRTLRRAKNALTIRMVMNHTGGFPFELPAKQPGIPGGGWSGGMPLRSVAAEAAAHPLDFEPGTRSQYSNTGIDIGAAVVEAVSGMKWEEFLKERVLDPLGMRSTCFRPTDDMIARKIEMYEVAPGRPARHMEQCGWEQRPYNDSHVFASAGAGLWTTVRDQYRFYKMLMNLGVGDNGARILKAETVKRYLANSTRLPDLPPNDLPGYSLGLKAAVHGGEDEWFGHGGAFGTNCMVNWQKRRLKLWAVQLRGSPRPWDKDREAAAERFFGARLEGADAASVTGRYGPN